MQPRDCQGRPFLEMLWFWGIQVIDFKKLWGSRNHCILSFQGKTTHDNSVTEITFGFSSSHRKQFLNLKYSVSVIEHMYKQNKNILMTWPSNVASLEVYSLAASEPNKLRNFLWSADVNINASLHLVILFKSMILSSFSLKG